jgi:opacity protein-like surface antigen
MENVRNFPGVVVMRVWKSRESSALVWMAALLACASAGAAGRDETDEPASDSGEPLRMEVAPFAGYRMGGSFTLTDTGQHVDLNDHGSFALALDLAGGPDTQYELFYGRQSTTLTGGAGFTPTDIRVEYLHIGGTEMLDVDRWPVRPYLVGGLGLTRLSPSISAQGSESTRFSLSLGAGLRAPLTRSFSLRLEARGFATLVDTNGAFFCRSDQAGLLCRVHARGSVFMQYEMLVGAAYAF